MQEAALVIWKKGRRFHNPRNKLERVSNILDKFQARDTGLVKIFRAAMHFGGSDVYNWVSNTEKKHLEHKGVLNKNRHQLKRRFLQNTRRNNIGDTNISDAHKYWDFIHLIMCKHRQDTSRGKVQEKWQSSGVKLEEIGMAKRLSFSKGYDKAVTMDKRKKGRFAKVTREGFVKRLRLFNSGRTKIVSALPFSKIKLGSSNILNTITCVIKIWKC